MIPFVITGDTHGEYGRYVEIMNLMEKYRDEKEKFVCVTGDFGYLFLDDFSEHKLLNEMEKADFVFVVVPGNHENYEKFQEYEIVDFYGAKAHKIRKNIFYIRRGEIFTIGGKSFFAMSGGYSVDKDMRREDYSWWRDEMPTDADYKYALENIEKHRNSGGKIDYVISHTAPLSGLEILGKNHGLEEMPLNNFLEYVRELLKGECITHYFGHLHVDKDMPYINQRALWFDYEVLSLEEQ